MVQGEDFGELKSVNFTGKIKFYSAVKPTRYKRLLKCVIADIYGNFGKCKGKPNIPQYKITEVDTERALGLILKHADSCPPQYDNYPYAGTGLDTTFGFQQQVVKPLRVPNQPKPKIPSGRWLYNQLMSCCWTVIDFRPRHDGIEYIVRRLEAEDFEE
ncbi:MAG TPA: hypothetical protein ENI23_11350 [bacterium]|nr:hypothetical protein [bacterium]